MNKVVEAKYRGTWVSDGSPQETIVLTETTITDSLSSPRNDTAWTEGADLYCGAFSRKKGFFSDDQTFKAILFDNTVYLTYKKQP